MEFKEGSNIVSVDGKPAGHLHRVVIDPDTNKVTHIVIQRGLLAKQDIVVDAQKIGLASPDEVSLLCTADELKEMPPFIITQYTPTDSQSTSSASMLYPNSFSTRSMAVETRRTIPEELVALKEGARVVSGEDEHVGNVERVITDPVTGQVTQFIIAKGLLLKERKLIPFDWVSSLGEDEVHLTVNTQQLEDLPEFQE